MLDSELIRKFINCFSKLDDLAEYLPSEIHPELRTGIDELERTTWEPKHFIANEMTLTNFYKQLGLPGRGSTKFPPLFEQLICNWRWEKVELDGFRLLANPPEKDLTSLANNMMEDKGLWTILVPNGYVPFAKAPDINYDPVCFDFRNRQKNQDCRIVQLYHEDILCNSRIKEVCEIAPNFRALVQQTNEACKR